MALFNLTNKHGLAGIKGFVVSQTPYDICNSGTPTTDFTKTLYHDGANALPVVGDKIFTNNIGTIIYDELNIHRQVRDNGDNLRVNDIGVMITQC